VSGREAKTETNKLIRKECYVRKRDRKWQKKEIWWLTIITVTPQLQRGLPNNVLQTTIGTGLQQDGVKGRRNAVRHRGGVLFTWWDFRSSRRRVWKWSCCGMLRHVVS
jgi:hypothetical protein